MVNKQELDRRYAQFFGMGDKTGLTSEHEHPEKLSNSRLVAELDDIIQVLCLASNVDYTDINCTEPGRALALVMHELKQRLEK